MLNRLLGEGRVVSGCARHVPMRPERFESGSQGMPCYPTLKLLERTKLRPDALRGDTGAAALDTKAVETVRAKTPETRRA